MEEKVFRCMQCDLPEERCPCPRYCILCKNPETCRLVGDGLYYCADCREACEYHTQEQIGH